MSEKLVIQSHKGPYWVVFDNTLLSRPEPLLQGEPHFLIDKSVARLYELELGAILGNQRTIRIEANEENKSIEGVIPILEQLVANKVRRDQTLVAIGGGIIQDITCFIASTLLRGMNWRFVPTTLLAQADSCIGSKSSINLGSTKNILGTFNPPNEIFVDSTFLNTLDDKDIRSGIGEILKVHAIEGETSFDRATADYEAMLADRSKLLEYVREALRIKQKFIEIDEFDRGTRNIFNYGHSFGHAIESATGFSVPHGIAVTMGMDVANHIAVQRGLLPKEHFHRMHGVLHRNYAAYADSHISTSSLLSALTKDKKNTATKLVLIFPVGDDAHIERVQVAPDDVFRKQCSAALWELKK